MNAAAKENAAMEIKNAKTAREFVNAWMNGSAMRAHRMVASALAGQRLRLAHEEERGLTVSARGTRAAITELERAAEMLAAYV